MMGVSLRVRWIALAILWLAPGCHQAPVQQAQQVTQQRLALESHGRELQARVNELDAENARVNELLAQSERQAQLLSEQSDAYREQLAGAMDQVARLKEDNAHSTRRVETLQASTRRQGSAMITPNNSLNQKLPAINVPGTQVRRSGEEIHIEIAAVRLFDGDEARLKPEGGKLLEAVTREVIRDYAGHRIGVESHTDNSPVRSGQFSNSHQLSLARATAVFDYLTRNTALRSEQLTIVGFGPNRPQFSNGTPAGQQRNRRIELVIYPDRVAASR